MTQFNKNKTCKTKESTTGMTEKNPKNTPKKALSTTQLCIFLLILGSISYGLIYLSVQADKHINATENPNPLLHKTELKQVLKMHAMLDKDQNGVISRDEVAFLADKIQSHPSNDPSDEKQIPKEKQIDFLIQAADLNEDGVINVAEFEKMWERHEKTRIAREKFNENKNKAK